MYRMLVTAALAVGALNAVPAFAVQRTFVASFGGDGGPCTLAQPCRGFSAALLLTDADGEIVVLDSAGYGVFTVSKGVSIIAPPGIYAGISVFAGQDGVTVNAEAGDRVVLRGLSISGQGGNHGIVVTQGGSISINGCTVANMLGAGIRIDGGTAVYVTNSELRSNNEHGIRVTGGTSAVFIDQTSVIGNTYHGILVEGGTLSVNHTRVENNVDRGLMVAPAAPGTIDASIRDSLFAGNGNSGILAATVNNRNVHLTVEGSSALGNAVAGFYADGFAGGTITFVVSDSVSNENNGAGVFAAGAGTTVSISSSTVSHNQYPGLFQNSGAVVKSHGNNAVEGNVGGETSGTITTIGLI